MSADSTDVSDQDDDYDEVLDADPTPLERFMLILEDKMLSGVSRSRCSSWATGMGVSLEVFNSAYDGVRASWQISASGLQDYCDQRDLQRARLNKIYDIAMRRENLRDAMRAVHEIVALDGLAAPAQLNIGLQPTGQGAITNVAREQVARLVEKMKLLAAKKRGDAGVEVTRALAIIDADSVTDE